jgi:hypothetical protein
MPIGGWFSRETRVGKSLMRGLPARILAFDKDIVELRRKAEWPGEGPPLLEPAVLALWAQLVALRHCGLAEDAVLRLAEVCQECAANHVARRISIEARNPEQMTAPQRSMFHTAVIAMQGRVRDYDEAYGRGTGPLLAEFCRNLVGPAQAMRLHDRMQPALGKRVEALLREAAEGLN